MLWVIQRQLRSKTPGRRRRAVEQLVAKPHAGALGDLERLLQEEPDVETRCLAVAAAAKTESPDAIEVLLRALKDLQPEVVKTAILALRKFADPQADILLASLLRHSDGGVRGHAAKILEARAWRPGNREDEIWFLAGRGQFSRLGPYGSAALPALEAALHSHAATASVGAVEALTQIRDPRAQRLLVLSLRSSDPGIAAAAVQGLARGGDEQVVEPLAQALRHPHPQVRTVAVEALGRLRARQAAPEVRALLSDTAWEVRLEAVSALGRMRDAESVEALAQMLKDQDGDVREACAMTLGNIGDRRVIRPLVLALKDPASGVRRIASAALSRIDSAWSSSPEARAAAEELRSALEDDDPAVRHSVSQLLISLGTVTREELAGGSGETAFITSPEKRRKLAVSLFLAVLCDPDADLRQAAAEALGRLSDSRAGPALARAKNDPDPGVAAAAAAAWQAAQPDSVPWPSSADRQPII